MKRFKYIIFMFALFFFIKLMISCGKSNNPDPIFFNYNSLQVSARNVWYPNINYDTVTVEKVNKNKIRLSLTVSDSLESKNMFFSKVISSLNGFETISATTEPEIFQYYTANQNIKKIEIYTLQHFNDTIQSGEDISNEFLVDNDNILYTKIPNAFKILNRDFYVQPYNTINLVCKIPAKTGTGQFKVKVILSDDRVLEAETLPIQFIENDEN